MTNQPAIPYHKLTQCFVSKTKKTIIDMQNPYTGNTAIYNTPLEELRKEYHDAEIMHIDDFCSWKAEQQRTPIAWNEISEEKYNYMLNALHPIAYGNGRFMVGEPSDHDAGNGQPRYSAFKTSNGLFFESSRPMTREEFRKTA